MNNITRGRQDLNTWEAGKPQNFFSSDSNLQYVLRRYMGRSYGAAVANFETFGGQVATIIDEAAKVEDRIGNHPRLQRWSGVGERIEDIEFHPNHDHTGRLIWEARLLALQAEPGNSVEQMGLYYLLGHNSEGGHMCSLACTSGLIRALQQVGERPVRNKFLPPLLDPDYEGKQHGAQFLTEVQGGSDVGSNAVIATRNRDGTWRVNGEKWFCSNINADQFLLTARPEKAPDGTSGLGLFLVPRKLDDGAINGFTIRRLKDKLGTRTLASAEVDFVDAVAYPVGAVDRGFKNVVELVLNTSRLMNAVACAGLMHRAYLEAAHYACTRQAFGSVIASFPLVQEAVADILSETYAAVSSGFYLADLLDRMESGRATEGDSAVYRLLVNINKTITSIRGTEMVHRAIEVLGGNGAIEEFSILPRLYRDMVVFESWEGTHNVLCLQVLRDITRYGIHEPFVNAMSLHLASVTHPQLVEYTTITREALNRALATLARLQANGEKYAQAHVRRFVDELGQVAQAVLLLAEAQWELDNSLPTIKPDVATHYINRHLRPDYDAMDDEDYLSRLERLMGAV